MTACPFVYMDFSVPLYPPSRPSIPPRSRAETELFALLEEIGTWPDATLLHMHKRFGMSRLFRVHHAPDGPMTDRARQLRDAALLEIARRGLSPLPEED